MTCDLPSRNGKHLIFNIWQRSDSPEAFYSCSDVNFSGGDDNGFKQLGTLVAASELPPGTMLTFRLLDKSSSDVEEIAITLQENQGAPEIWPYILAQAVNAQSQVIRIGILSENGEVEPTQQLNGNIVYSISGTNFTFVIDKQINDDAPFNFVYPDAIGQYQAGTIVFGKDGNRYQCKPVPYSGWCNQAPFYYEPGNGSDWQDAWFIL